MLDSDAYRALSGNAVKLMSMLHKRHTGGNNGDISMSVREAAHEVGCCPNHAVKCFKELGQAGSIRETVKGSFTWKTRHATTWRLTWLPTQNPSALAHRNEPTKEFMRLTVERAKKI